MAVLRLLGPVDVVDSAGRVSRPGSPIRATLLALLGLNAGRVVEAEWLLDVAWDGEPPSSGLRALRFHISKLRSELGIDGLIATVGSGYRIDATTDIDGAEAAQAIENLSATAAATALDLWRGEALSGTQPCASLEHEQARLSELRLDLIGRRCRALVAEGQAAAVIGELSRLCLEHPLREGLWATLITAHYRAGNQAEALRCYDRLRLALVETAGVDPSPPLQQLYEDVLHQRQHLHSLGESDPTKGREGNLPERRATLVGRDDQIAHIHDRLGEYRLVTLTGVGGVGKTSLALEFARTSGDMYPNGCWLVELAGVPGDGQVTTATLSSLGIQPRGGMTPLDALCSSLTNLELLVILDNCEHVLGGVVDLAEGLLDGLPGVTLLATSREGLGIRGEYQLTVPSLDTAGTDSRAAQLFRQRAGESGWTADASDDDAIEELCSRLDGIPLAIELAAARTRSMTVTQLRDRLGSRFRLLKGTRRGVERHQTLQATVAWSYGLLEPDEQALFDRLCVFPGPFELSAAETIFGSDQIDEFSVGELLGSLVNKSMLIADCGVFHLLETLRQFGEERIGEEIVDQARRGHSRYYRSFVAEAHDGLLGPDESAWAQRLETAWPNIRAALNWAVQHGDTNTALSIVAHLGHDLIMERHRVEVCGWARAVIELPGAADELLYPSCVGVAASGLLWGGNYELGESLARAAVDACTDQSLDLDQLAHYSLALALQISGRTDEAIAEFERIVEAAAKLHPLLHTASLSQLAEWQTTSLRYIDAARNASASLSVARRTGNPTAIAFALFAQGHAKASVDPVEAIRLYDEALAVTQADSWNTVANISRVMKAHALMDIGRSDDALELGLSTGRQFRRGGNLFLARISVLASARAIDALGDPTTAALLYGAEGWAHRTDPYSIQRKVLRARLVDALGESIVTELVERGAAMTAPEALDLAEAAAESIRPAQPTP